MGCTWFLWQAGDTVFVVVFDFVNNVISNDDEARLAVCPV